MEQKEEMNHFINRRLRAVLVGVTDYRQIPDTPDLPAGQNDVALMGDALVKGLSASPLHIWVKQNDPGYVTREDFLSGIRYFLSDVSEKDTVVFYFSGHGTMLPEGHALLLSDGPLLTQSVIDLFDELHVKNRLLLLDCCMSGAHDIRPAGRLGTDGWLEDLLKGGTTVFASSRDSEYSWYPGKMPVSLFTLFLWRAMTNRFCIRNEKISMDMIRYLVLKEAEAWNESHPDYPQHPVFRSNLGGALCFPIRDFRSYLPGRFFLDQKGYCIESISPLHSQIAKRYVARVILKHAVTRKDLCAYNREIVHIVKSLEIFNSKRQENQWKGKPLDLLFGRFGYSRMDVAKGNYAFCTTWARTRQEQKKWYSGNGEVKRGIWIAQNRSYQLCRTIIEKNTGDEKQVICQTKKTMRRLIDLGEEVVEICREYQNGTLFSETLEAEFTRLLPEIDRLYLQLSDFPVAPLKLIWWSQLCDSVAGDIQDFSALLKKGEGKASDQWMDERTRAVCHAAMRFHEDLDRLAEEEESLKREQKYQTLYEGHDVSDSKSQP